MSYITITDSLLVDIVAPVFVELFNTGSGRRMIEIDGSEYVRCEGFVLSRCRTEAVVVTDSTHVTINDGTIREPCRHADDTYDAVVVTSSDFCRVTQLTIVPEVGGNLPRYGINIVSGNDNIVVGNNLGAAADYGTAPIGDSGTGTILDYPSDATWGDNFVS